MKIVLVCGGNPPSYELLKEELEDSDYLICADSGGNCLYRYKIVPHYLMGDFDSIDKEALEFFIEHKECKVEEFPPDKDFTDTELALNKAAELGGTEIVFLGCTGTRIDHTIGNLGMLRKCLDLNIKGHIRDEHNIITICDKPVTLKGEKGSTFSIQAYCDCVEKVNIIGARYKLTDYDLRLGDSRTVSNEFLNDDVQILFKKGTLLILYSKD